MASLSEYLAELEAEVAMLAVVSLAHVIARLAP
jgi:hypothetical protein